mmetsp:Transcript_62912/g.177433  ORF Transcript_62912/g.177433 Transcript_62912/m.177433 type:complete len:371 (+) Transcript_62912:804-1916(+)
MILPDRHRVLLVGGEVHEGGQGMLSHLPVRGGGQFCQVDENEPHPVGVVPHWLLVCVDGAEDAQRADRPSNRLGTLFLLGAFTLRAAAGNHPHELAVVRLVVRLGSSALEVRGDLVQGLLRPDFALPHRPPDLDLVGELPERGDPVLARPVRVRVAVLRGLDHGSQRPFFILPERYPVRVLARKILQPRQRVQADLVEVRVVEARPRNQGGSHPLVVPHGRLVTRLRGQAVQRRHAAHPRLHVLGVFGLRCRDQHGPRPFVLPHGRPAGPAGGQVPQHGQRRLLDLPLLGVSNRCGLEQRGPVPVAILPHRQLVLFVLAFVQERVHVLCLGVREGQALQARHLAVDAGGARCRAGRGKRAGQGTPRGWLT